MPLVLLPEPRVRGINNSFKTNLIGERWKPLGETNIHIKEDSSQKKKKNSGKEAEEYI
ncbi:hypothetical protein CWI38_0535p0040 [Hamiltosporidium tvaerminnensis]|uniref:Uncharacterized protein n=1 Tax=Hamiltosporidium tvaerminnensis TaxID=1176355 RepID=A0A4Q9LWH8_9MICR|nr:hypothetical protein CWI38_0535p0040 [Hamiltosporidium tvaerminnensis]